MESEGEGRLMSLDCSVLLVLIGTGVAWVCIWFAVGWAADLVRKLAE
jgi:hypothetical protein